MRVGLIGNPNVGKSTIFNGLTGMRQHTGNWPGKTVAKATGYKVYNGMSYQFEDLPGTYSLLAHSKEEDVTRNFVYFDDYDALIVVCDATALERNLNLVLQVLEITDKVVVCVNLLDEAKKKRIDVDLRKLSLLLGVPVVGAIARDKKGFNDLLDKVKLVSLKKEGYVKINYDNFILKDIKKLEKFIPKNLVNSENVLLRYLASDYDFINSFDYKYKTNLMRNLEAKYIKEDILNGFKSRGVNYDDIDTIITEAINEKSYSICKRVVKYNKDNYDKKERIIDKYLTNKITGIPIMLCLLFLILWITITLANIPSDFLYEKFFEFEDILYNFLVNIHLPIWVTDMFVHGIYRVLAWVVAVMLPPMAIFFPLFTLLEDFGVLPRIAFNLDKSFEKCSSCGKQALTMVMGFGCNAVGVTGARIIDSPRERLIAIITNSFVPCNGRFPLLISLITMFLVTNNSSGLMRAFILLIFILVGVIVTFIVSKILSNTILKGVPSSFTLELPPYRRPQIGKVLVRSLIDRTLFVLKRAVCVSAPAGLVIWIFSNVAINGVSLLKIFSDFLDPFGKFIGLDGVIIMAFILGFPANEIVIPIMIMGYMSLGMITDMNDLNLLKELFVNNGWTYVTAICVMLFSLFHFPCLTTLVTIKKETGKWKWAFISFIIPLIIGIGLCFIIRLFFIH